jgi:hypothetical protein
MARHVSRARLKAARSAYPVGAIQTVVRLIGSRTLACWVASPRKAGIKSGHDSLFNYFGNTPGTQACRGARSFLRHHSL